MNLRHIIIGLALAGCSAGASQEGDECAGDAPSCDCDGTLVPGTCSDGLVECACPPTQGTGSGGGGQIPESSGGSESTGGAFAETGGAEQSGGAVSTGGASSTGGEPQTGGAPATGGAVSTGGSEATGGGVSTGGAVEPGNCEEKLPCDTAGSRNMYCGGDQDEPTCQPCAPGWCNCSQGPTYEDGGPNGGACETRNPQIGGYCFTVCSGL